MEMLAVSKRIELVTQLNVTSRHGSTSYQSTNYGLGGLVDTHMDPYGYEHGTRKVFGKWVDLITRGDYIATFMGWLNKVSAGGGTFLSHPGYETVLKPTKGAAAFWINLSSCHRTDSRSTHGGCPVLRGSKWIVNKWIYSWDQWKKWPCQIQKGMEFDLFREIGTF